MDCWSEAEQNVTLSFLDDDRRKSFELCSALVSSDMQILALDHVDSDT